MGIRDSIFGRLKKKKKETEEYIDDLQETKRKRIAERDVEKAQAYLGPEFKKEAEEIRKKHLEALKLIKERADAEVERQKRISIQEKKRLEIPPVRYPSIEETENVQKIANKFAQADKEILRQRKKSEEELSSLTKRSRENIAQSQKERESFREGRFRCPDCNKVFPTQFDYYEHYKKAHSSLAKTMDVVAGKSSGLIPKKLKDNIPGLVKDVAKDAYKTSKEAMVTGKTVGEKKYPSIPSIFGGSISKGAGIGSTVFSKNVCPYCHSPTIEVKVGKDTRHMCSRDSCPYSHPKKCPICREESLDIDTNTKKTFCTNEKCGTNTGDEEKAQENIKKLESHVSDYGIKGERLEEHHKDAVWRTALVMMLGVIPMIFPGGMAGIMFLLGIWSLALEFYFPAKVKHEGSMIFKGFSRVGTIVFFTLGFFFFGQPLLSLGMLLLGYYSLPSGIADHDKYRKFLGLFRTCFAIGLVALSIVALGGPMNFRMSLAAFVFAFLFSIPSKKGEAFEALIFVFASIAGMALGLYALGTALSSPMILFGFGIVAAGLVMYAISKLPWLEEKNKEEIEDKDKEEKEEIEEKKLEIEEEIEKEVESEEKSAKLKKIDKDMGVV